MPMKNGEVVHIVCDKPDRGQFVKIQMTNNQQEFISTLFEIRVLVLCIFFTSYHFNVYLLIFFS